MEKNDSSFTLTDGAMRLIEDVVEDQCLTDRLDILNAVCDVLEKKYHGDAFESHLDRMHMSTTQEILRAIDVYFIIRQDFPAYSFHRCSANRKKKQA